MPAYPFKATKSGGHLPTAGQLWKRVPADVRQSAARAFWADKEPSAQAEAMVEIARHLNFRPKSVQALPLEKRIHHLAAMPSLSDSVAGQVLVAYHLAHQRPMMAAFLDSIGIAHDQAVISEPDKLEAPDAARLAKAAGKLFAAYPVADVELYLSTLAVQDVGVWGGLIDVLSARAHEVDEARPGA